MMKSVLVICVLLILSPAALVQAEDLSERFSSPAKMQCFELWNFNLPVGLFVADVLPDAEHIGLSRLSVERTVRNRLQAADLYRKRQKDLDANAAYLYVNAYVHDNAFALIFRYRKGVMDISSMTLSMATTWHNEVAGKHAYDAGFILTQVSVLTDHFIDRYLEANQDESCLETREKNLGQIE